MIIHPPQIETKDGEITLSSRIETQRELAHFPKTLWFTFPETYRDYIAVDRGEAFLLSMLVPAMFYGEELEVLAPISPLLAYAMPHFQGLFQYISGQKLRVTPIHTPTLSPSRPPVTPTARCLAFSGGVDSTYSLISHLPESEHFHGLELTHTLFIGGFYDMTLDRPDLYQRRLSDLTETLAPYPIEMLQARTNVHAFSRYQFSWVFHHGPALLGVAFALSNLIGTFVRATGNSYNVFPNAEVALGDFMLRTESFSIFNHGAHRTRYDKTVIASEWPLAVKSFKVCLVPPPDIHQTNCGRCRKCLSAMVTLAISGTADKLIEVLPRLTFGGLLRWWMFHTGLAPNDRELIDNAKANKKWGYWLILVVLNPLRVLKRRWLRKLFAKIPEDRQADVKRWLEKISFKYQL